MKSVNAPVVPVLFGIVSVMCLTLVLVLVYNLGTDMGSYKMTGDILGVLDRVEVFRENGRLTNEPLRAFFLDPEHDYGMDGHFPGNELVILSLYSLTGLESLPCVVILSFFYQFLLSLLSFCVCYRLFKRTDIAVLALVFATLVPSTGPGHGPLMVLSSSLAFIFMVVYIHSLLYNGRTHYIIALLMTIGILVTHRPTTQLFYILVAIIPRFAAIFQQLGAELPGPTMMLVHISNILVNHGIWVIVGMVLLCIIYSKINKTKGGKMLFDRMKLRAPAVGELIRKIAIARFADTLSTLINSGVPILQALDIVRDTSGNEVVAQAMEKVYNSVKDGETIHEPLAESKVFPPLVIHMVAVGEETGAIDHMLLKVAEAYEREVNDTVNALTSILEPLLIVFLGVIIGTIVVALYLPYFMLPSIVGQ